MDMAPEVHRLLRVRDTMAREFSASAVSAQSEAKRTMCEVAAMTTRSCISDLRILLADMAQNKKEVVA